jgi:hypothetical protein
VLRNSRKTDSIQTTDLLRVAPAGIPLSLLQVWVLLEMGVVGCFSGGSTSFGFIDLVSVAWARQAQTLTSLNHYGTAIACQE